MFLQALSFSSGLVEVMIQCAIKQETKNIYALEQQQNIFWKDWLTKLTCSWLCQILKACKYSMLPDTMLLSKKLILQGS